MQLELFPPDIHLRCIDPAKGKRRFYAMSVERDLLGQWVLVREWGRIDGARRVRLDAYGSVGQAILAMRKLAQQKRGRGYRSAVSVPYG